MSQPNNIIPFYHLYGDRQASGEPDFVHIEDIEARSSDLGWVIKPHRHKHLFQVIAIFDGELEIQLSENNHFLTGTWLVTVPVGVVHGFRFKPESKGLVLSVIDNVLSGDRQEYPGAQFSELFQQPQLVELAHNSKPLALFKQYMALIREEFANFGSDKNLALTLLARSILLMINRQLQHNKLALPDYQDSAILSRFRGLVESHFRDQWSVADYAEALHTSTSTLNRLCHQTLDQSPKQIIQERVIAEAKSKLIYTQLSLKEIAYHLGFNDYPYFSRFFKKMTGITAGSYRQQAEEER